MSHSHPLDRTIQGDDPGKPFTQAWARDVLARGGRQVVQVITPVLVAMAAGSAGGFTLRGILLAALAAVAFTIVKALSGLSTDPTDPFYLQTLERAVAAAGGAFLAYFVAGPATDLLNLPWHAIGWAVLGAVGLSFTAMLTNPPQPQVVGPLVDEAPQD